MYNYKSPVRPNVLHTASLCSGSSLLLAVKYSGFVATSRIYRSRTYLKVTCYVPLLCAALAFGRSVSKFVLHRFVISEAEHVAVVSSPYSLLRDSYDCVAHSIDYCQVDKCYRVELAFEAKIF